MKSGILLPGITVALLAPGIPAASATTEHAGDVPARVCAATHPEHGSSSSSAGDWLAALLVELRAGALSDGVEPIPGEIRASLEGFVPDPLLDAVRWRVGALSRLSPHAQLGLLGLVAVTLDDVIVFADRETALSNAGIWAHELRHVMQYRACGVQGFAHAYLTRHAALENDADQYALAWHRWTLDRWLASLSSDEGSGGPRPPRD
jgi:hypothetical protein